MEDQILTEHFRLSEFTRSSIADANGIKNEIEDSKIRENLKNLCVQVLEPLRIQVGEPIIISSGYRSPELNRLVGGVHNSQHLIGEAADIYTPDSKKRRDWFTHFADGIFDQLIMESDGNRKWIHVSCRPDITQNRQQILCISK